MPRAIDGWKVCSSCHLRQPATSEFYGAHPTTADRLQSQCRACNKSHCRKRASENREDALAKTIAWQKANRERSVAGAARQRARKRGIPFSITPADVVIPEKCPALGLVLKTYIGGPEGGAKPDSASLDRRVPELGYVPGNVQVISAKANQMKSNASPDELWSFALWVLLGQGADPEVVASLKRDLTATKKGGIL